MPSVNALRQDTANHCSKPINDHLSRYGGHIFKIQRKPTTLITHPILPTLFTVSKRSSILCCVLLIAMVIFKGRGRAVEDEINPALLTLTV